jgi:hypothetical protein
VIWIGAGQGELVKEYRRTFVKRDAMLADIGFGFG